MPGPQLTFNAAPAAGMVGLTADLVQGQYTISQISGETTLQLPFGSMVMQGTNDDQMVSLNTQTPTKLLGIIEYNGAYQINHQIGNVADTNGNIGILPNITAGVKRRGRIWVYTDEAVTVGAAVRVRTTTAGGGFGTFRKTASTGVTLLLKSANWVYTAAANGPALLEFDMVSMTFAAD